MTVERVVEERIDASARADSELFASLYPRLRRFAAVVAPEEVDPDDIVQDALERTLRLHSLTTLDDPRAYLSRVILNLASNQRRGFARARNATARLQVDEASPPTYPSDIAELMRLPAQQRAILFLAEVEGFTQAEIATQLKMTEAAVSKASQRARRRLSAELREEMR
jgi:RNA polymerase sigma factor (sigma-70 family)